MRPLAIINSIECRARACGLPITELFKAAKVNKQTWYRWKSGAVSPTISVINKSVKRMEDALVAREVTQRNHLNNITQHVCPHCGEPLQQELEAAE